MKKYIIFFLTVLFFILGVSSTSAARLYFRMEKTTYKTGETGFVTFNVDTESKTVNAFEATVTFDPGLIEITRMSSDKLIINFWIQSANIDNVNGRITFKGIALNPAFKGDPGRLIGFDFKAKAPGKFSFNAVNFTILANDGKGTKLATKISPREISISGPAINRSGVIISSKTHPDQKKWYNKSNISLSWSTSEKDITAFAYGFNKNSNSELSTDSITKVTSTTQKNVSDGTWYAHVRAQHKTKGWLSTAHFKVNVDTIAPPVLTLSFAPRLNESILPTVRINSRDDFSGIVSYEVLANGKSLIKANALTSFKLKSLKVGKNVIEVKVIDAAGNVRSEKISVLYNPLSSKESSTPTKPTNPVTPTPTPTTPKINKPILFD